MRSLRPSFTSYLGLVGTACAIASSRSFPTLPKRKRQVAVWSLFASAALSVLPICWHLVLYAEDLAKEGTNKTLPLWTVGVHCVAVALLFLLLMLWCYHVALEGDQFSASDE